jgi:excisionase family DNA binding protein
MADAARPLLTVDDVAKLLSKTPHAVRKMRERGQLPEAVKLRRCVRWRAADLEAWIAAQPRD